MKITLEDIFNIPSAVIYYPDLYESASHVSIDSRTIKKNSIYVAIKGNKYDGHDYVSDAIKNGAIAIIVSNRKLNRFDKVKVPIISVRNTIDAYGALAKIWRSKQKAKVISITGSNGKTTTKEILAHLLEGKYKVHKTLLNNNNQIGVPLTIFSTPNNADYLILEHGTNHFGEIEHTAKIAEPDYSIITNIGNSHTEFLESKEKILEEKSGLFNNTSQNGIVFINNDDPLLRGIKKKYPNNVTYGFKANSQIRGKKFNSDKYNLVISNKETGKEFKVNVPLIGDSNLANYLAAVAVCLKVNVPAKEILNTTKSLKPVKGRLDIKDYKTFTIIDDTYNANPESVKSAIDILTKFRKRKHKILVLGSMFELGKNEALFHREIGELLNKKNVDKVFTIGKEAKSITKAIVRDLNKKHFSSREALKKQLNKLDITNSVILVKGSRGMKMEEFVYEIEKRAI